MKKIIAIYHRADFDGIFCREIARKFLGDMAEYVGWDYGDSDAIIPPGIERIYMLDISVASWMTDPRLIWIDHHKSAMEKYSASGYQIDGVAACRLAWQYFFKYNCNRNPLAHEFATLPRKQDFIDRKVDEPLAVRLAGEYDIWDKRDPRAELFQHGLRSCDLSGYWPNLLREDEETVALLLERGEALQYAQTRQNESIIKEMGFTIEFEGLKFLACNNARYNSFLFTAGLRPEHDGCFGFKWTGKKWSVSLYHAPGKEHHDLSLIASKFGGGGHRGACGFQTDKLPFLS